MLLRGLGDGSEDRCAAGLRQHARSVLRVHQHHVGPDRSEARDPLGNRAAHIARPVVQNGVGPDLPDHQLRMLGDHGGFEPREHAGNFLAVDAPIEHLERMTGKALLELGLELARVGVRLRACAEPERGGRADRHDLDRQTARQAQRDVAQRTLQADKLRLHGALGKIDRPRAILCKSRSAGDHQHDRRQLGGTTQEDMAQDGMTQDGMTQVSVARHRITCCPVRWSLKRFLHNSPDD